MIGPTLRAGLSGRRLYPVTCQSARAQPIMRLEPTSWSPSKLGHHLAAHPPARYTINMTDEGKFKIVDEHFWFTATTLGFNAFIISSNSVHDYHWQIRIISTFISLFALFLIIHRSAAHANKIEGVYPQDIASLPQKDRTWRHKLSETLCHFKVVVKHIPFVICEFSGSLFYCLLVTISCVGVWFLI
jgi:hypothetical protein